MFQTILLALCGLITSVYSAASDFNGAGAACVANGYGYCPTTQVCFQDQSLPNPDPTSSPAYNASIAFS